MTTMIHEIYEAPKEAGASEEKATAGASVVLAEFLHRENTGDLAKKSDLRELRSGLRELESGVRELDANVREEIGGVRGEIGGVRGEVQNLDKRLEPTAPRFKPNTSLCPQAAVDPRVMIRAWPGYLQKRWTSSPSSRAPAASAPRSLHPLAKRHTENLCWRGRHRALVG